MRIVNARDYLSQLYIDWFDNYISMSVFAEHHGLTIVQAGYAIELGRQIHNSKHPER